MFERIYPLIADQLDAVLDRQALRAARELVRVVPSTLGASGPIIGAAERALEPMLAPPWLAARDHPRPSTRTGDRVTDVVECQSEARGGATDRMTQHYEGGLTGE